MAHYAISILLITARKRSLGQGNMFTGVCLSTGVGACSWGGYMVQGVHAPGGVHDPGGGLPGGDPSTATAAGGTHPTGMHSDGLDIYTLSSILQHDNRGETDYWSPRGRGFRGRGFRGRGFRGRGGWGYRGGRDFGRPDFNRGRGQYNFLFCG